MNKAKLLLIVNVSAFIALLISAATGIMMWLGSRGMRDVHVYASLIFVAIVLIHVLLHYSWIKNMIFR
ncbi:MAG: DUF4405 domain-containing protein [Candidatus Woesearchaeota archaeon]|nr:DUF4405 domain-containing protein [Candidatus Woesearchaeota archaeon]